MSHAKVMKLPVDNCVAWLRERFPTYRYVVVWSDELQMFVIEGKEVG